MAKVKLDRVSRKFKNVSAVEDITFEVPDGEFWVLVGPSGCGKSTILRMIAGLEDATQGDIYIGNTLVNHLSARERDVAMVFQNYALYPHMSVSQNLAFPLKMRKVEKTNIQKRILEVARALAIEHLLHRKPKELSGGQQQRVALGRAIAREPQVFLLDEPLSNLDAQLRDDTRGQLKQLHQHLGITTIYVTHDQTEAMTLGDSLVVLNNGRIQQIGTPQEVYHHPANRMVATFLGNPPMNIIPCTLFNNSFMMGTQSLPIPPQIISCLPPLASFDIGIRPEHISITDDTTSSLQVVLQVVEPLGRETLVRCKIDSTDTVINLTADANFKGAVGDRIYVCLSPSNLLFFHD